MNFENLKGLLGEAYHENITADEVNAFFAGKSFADLSTGQYVDKNKYERDVQALNKTISDQKTTINSKLTEDEKKAADVKAKDDEILRLQTLLKQNTLTSNGDLVGGIMANTKSLLDIKDDDENYKGFIKNIVGEDRQVTMDVANYVAKMIKDAYDKGQKDATKDAMGKFGKSAKSNTSDTSKTESLGAMLGKNRNAQNNKETMDYFKRK